MTMIIRERVCAPGRAAARAGGWWVWLRPPACQVRRFAAVLSQVAAGSADPQG